MDEALPGEAWLPVEGFEGSYVVSNFGRVRSLDRYGYNGARLRGRLLAVHLDPDKYRKVSLRKDGRSSPVFVHRLVAMTFDVPGVGPIVRHLNDRKWDNRAVNLAWGTAADNARDRHQNRRYPNALKTHCPLGHAYIGVNLIIEKTPHRKCRACTNASVVMRRNGAPRGMTHAELADIYYRAYLDGHVPGRGYTVNDVIEIYA